MPLRHFPFLPQDEGFGLFGGVYRFSRFGLSHLSWKRPRSDSDFRVWIVHSRRWGMWIIGRNLALGTRDMECRKRLPPMAACAAKNSGPLDRASRCEARCGASTLAARRCPITRPNTLMHRANPARRAHHHTISLNSVSRASPYSNSICRA
jgi:hypothetical protein